MTGQAEQQTAFNGWARVEILGHQTHIGFVRTEAYGAATLFRVDTPGLPEREYVLEEPQYVDVGNGVQRWCPKGTTVKRLATPGCSVLIGAGSIYRIIPCDEAAALKAIDSNERPALKLISLPEGRALPEPEESKDEIDDDAGDDDDEPLF